MAGVPSLGSRYECWDAEEKARAELHDLSLTEAELHTVYYTVFILKTVNSLENERRHIHERTHIYKIYENRVCIIVAVLMFSFHGPYSLASIQKDPSYLQLARVLVGQEFCVRTGALQ